VKTLSKKAKILTALVTAAAFCLFGVIAGWSCRSDLAKLKNWKGEFQYPGLRWGMSFEEVRDSGDWTYQGEEIYTWSSDDNFYTMMVDGKKMFHAQADVDEVDFNGMEWNGSLQFLRGLENLWLYTSIPMSELEKSDELLTELIDLYGEPEEVTTVLQPVAYTEPSQTRRYDWNKWGEHKTGLSMRLGIYEDTVQITLVLWYDAESEGAKG